MSLKALAAQVIVITGASSGIGLVTARLAAKRGARVMLVARNEDALRVIVDDIITRGGTAGYAVADVGDRNQLQAAADDTIARFGRIDSWVNHAGVAMYAKLLETPLDEHERLFRTNYFGAVNGTQVAMPHLIASKGALITVASIASDMPSPVMGAYTASKHALAAFIASLRIEFHADKTPVSVSLIKPSGMATPIARHAANHRAGAPTIPPPVYDLTLVAEAILDAATRPVRDLTVGGVGRLQVLFANHFPALFERIAPIVMPLLRDKDRPAVPGDNLFAPARDGADRLPDETGKRFSFYTAAARRPELSTGIAAAGSGLARFCSGAAARPTPMPMPTLQTIKTCELWVGDEDIVPIEEGRARGRAVHIPCPTRLVEDRGLLEDLARLDLTQLDAPHRRARGASLERFGQPRLGRDRAACTGSAIVRPSRAAPNLHPIARIAILLLQPI